MELFALSGHRRWWRNAAPGVAHSLLDLGRTDEAKAVLDEMSAQDRATDGPPGAFRLDAEARYRGQIGDTAASLELARLAVDEVNGTGAPFYEGRSRETLADLLALAGDLDGARREYALARDLYAAKGYLPGVARIDARAATAT